MLTARLTLLIAVLLSSAPALAATAPAGLDLKGARIGMTADELNQRFSGLNCQPPSSGEGSCDYLRNHPVVNSSIPELNTLAEQSVDSWTFKFNDGRLASIMILFPETFFDAVADAFRERFGKAARADYKIVQNRMGATLRSKHAMWKRGPVGLSIEQRGADLDTSMIFMTSSSAVKRGSEIRSEKNKTRAKDL